METFKLSDVMVFGTMKGKRLQDFGCWRDGFDGRERYQIVITITTDFDISKEFLCYGPDTFKYTDTA